jgi:hypothetical protein
MFEAARSRPVQHRMEEHRGSTEFCPLCVDLGPSPELSGGPPWLRRKYGVMLCLAAVQFASAKPESSPR